VPAWSFDTGLGYGRQAKFEATPIAIDGILYVTGLYNHAWAIDAKTGTAIWHYERQLTRRCACAAAWPTAASPCTADGSSWPRSTRTSSRSI
jgi:glucose dehydrogenase